MTASGALQHRWFSTAVPAGSGAIARTNSIENSPAHHESLVDNILVGDSPTCVAMVASRVALVATRVSPCSQHMSPWSQHVSPWSQLGSFWFGGGPFSQHVPLLFAGGSRALSHHTQPVAFSYCAFPSCTASCTWVGSELREHVGRVMPHMAINGQRNPSCNYRMPPNCSWHEQQPTRSRGYWCHLIASTRKWRLM
jgi:hypothetical protein